MATDAIHKDALHLQLEVLPTVGEDLSADGEAGNQSRSNDFEWSESFWFAAALER